jgi:DNA-binding NarL/FixJ family response regulator
MFFFRYDTDVVNAAIAAGASAYIEKGVPAPMLVSALRNILNGERFFHLTPNG